MLTDWMKRNSLLKDKLLYSFLIIAIFLLGKGVPLYLVDMAAYLHPYVDAETLLLQAVSGDINQCALFALGISPHLVASLTVQFLLCFKDADVRKKMSPVRRNRQTLVMAVGIAAVMAVIQVQKIPFCVSGELLFWAKMVAVLQLIAGEAIIILLISSNQKYGIGGQTLLVFVNLLSGLLTVLSETSWKQVGVLLLAALPVILLMIIMEEAEFRIPVQRISIHNIYADKNYLAIKLNPIGVMPAMFSSACFMMLQLLVTGIGMIFPQNNFILWVQERMVLSDFLGIALYVLVIYGLTLVFSRVMINPTEYSEQLLKSGDSIQDLHAGIDTTRYLSRVVTAIALLGATVMSVCLCVPMLLQANGWLEGALAAVPSSVMMLTGIWCNLYHEFLAVRYIDAYNAYR